MLLLAATSLPLGNINAQNNEIQWTEELRLKHISNVENPATWDMDRLNNDNTPPEPVPGFPNRPLPISTGPFPAPDYDSISMSSFKGIGMALPIPLPAYPDMKLTVGDKDVVYASFFVNDNPFYQSTSGTDRVFFTLITVTDSLDENGYAIGAGQISSRNHPDYIGQGFYQTTTGKIDFTAFTTPEGEEYAIVNMRLFHLKYGNVILVAPQKDGTFRSMQLDEKEVTSDESYEQIKSQILRRSDVIEFFSGKGVI